jgi:hypothetical protein
VIITIPNPFAKKAVAPIDAQSSKPAKAVESVMSTSAVVLAPTTAIAQSNGFVRFLDAIKNDFKKWEPVVEEVAVAAEPVLALSPFGPEYTLVVNAIVAARQTATASLAAGVNLSGTQQAALVAQAATPALTAILASAGITETTVVQTAIAEFIQNVYNLNNGPVKVTTTAASAAVKAATNPVS